MNKTKEFFFGVKDGEPSFFRIFLLFLITLTLSFAVAFSAIKIDEIRSKAKYEKDKVELESALKKSEVETNDEVILNGVTVVDGELSVLIISKWGEVYQEDVIKDWEETDTDSPYIEYKELKEDTKSTAKGTFVLEKLIVPEGFTDFEWN